MMHPGRLSLLGVLAMMPALSAVAEMCSIDPVPAATLLLPYFEVDLDDVNGRTTIFNLHNASPEPALVHIIFWTNWAAPTIDFDVYLAGYDVQAVNVRDIFNGNIPITADHPNDSDDSISPSARAEWDIHPGGPGGGFLNCQNFFPFFVNPVIQGTALDRLQNGHTGQPVASLAASCGSPQCCLGADLGDNVARGYITIDNVDECSLVLDPADPAYFVDGGTGIARDVNQLWGEVIYLDPANSTSHSAPLVHIEADVGFSSEVDDRHDSNYTFYGRYGEHTGRDNREPLGSVWAVHHDEGGAFESSDLIVWRDPTSSNTLSGGAACGSPPWDGSSGPDWLPLGQTEVVCFDEKTSYSVVCAQADELAFPLATQRVPASTFCGVAVPLFGWCHLNLNIQLDAPTGDVDFPFPDGNVSQSVVSVVRQITHSTANIATPVAHACTTDDPMVCAYDANDLDCDTVANTDDTDPSDPNVCQDLDDDTCDDCSLVQPPDPANDGEDGDGDGLCDAGDACPGDPDPFCVAVVLQTFSAE